MLAAIFKLFQNNPYENCELTLCAQDTYCVDLIKLDLIPVLFGDHVARRHSAFPRPYRRALANNLYYVHITGLLTCFLKLSGRLTLLQSFK